MESQRIKLLLPVLMIVPTIITSLIKVQRMLGLAQEIKTLSQLPHLHRRPNQQNQF